MPLTLYSHPFSYYCQKALVALWENDTPFTYRHLEEPGVTEERMARWPIGQFPVLLDDDRTIAESSIIIEHLDLFPPGPVRLRPEVREAALEVRFLYRFFDHQVMTHVQRPVGEALRGADGRREEAVERAARALDTAYDWLEDKLAGRRWAAGDDFTLADCAAAPSLFYADWVHPIGPDRSWLRGYRARLLARPSFARAVAEARPYRPYFPLGAPDRD